ncbi:hypothetical protein CAS74_003044 [Pichia kudriavzevii]|uniref:Ribosome biogenesis protein ALB1 n=2 Tax=Pichia kudriavzevii TaxID=4909 RepID=A0A1V2LUI5_PICKU|nr:uncharacterized protein C5L36_0E02110 [Pichia kudriavzevii]AWU78149.1 hypothetical protein C5L36_0E02110 [Pichia kudriavzevii]ONH77842.1 Ribosome biogenesis protein ALB1 [Pichia kudriavzevii]OUT22056.1 hypothetical protein CAS74_003044 [Pichia kudriavzevii]
MPSKNSINKPKGNITRQRKSHLASKKRAQRARQAVTSVTQATGSSALVPLSASGGVVVNTVLSNKKARKLERNLKYAQLRREGSVGKGKRVDVEMSGEEIAQAKDKENVYRKALWSVVERSRVQGIPIMTPVGQGTTLGGGSF